MLTQSVTGEEQTLQATETILQNLRVLATDQSTQTTTTEDGRTVVSEFRTVTLEVTPRIAEKIAVAETMGTLSLALRSIADNQAELERSIAAGDIDVPDDATAEEEERILSQAVARPRDGATTFVTGADVSRFQRRSQSKPANTATAPMSQGMGGQSRPAGPAVRVTRGHATSIAQVGSTGAILHGQEEAIGHAAPDMGLGISTLR